MYENSASYFNALGVRYNGQQERLPGQYSLDTFTDLETRTTFLRRPGETLLEALERVRRAYETSNI